MTITANCPMNLENFPMDTQVMHIQSNIHESQMFNQNYLNLWFALLVTAMSAGIRQLWALIRCKDSSSLIFSFLQSLPKSDIQCKKWSIVGIRTEK